MKFSEINIERMGRKFEYLIRGPNSTLAGFHLLFHSRDKRLQTKNFAFIMLLLRTMMLCNKQKCREL